MLLVGLTGSIGMGKSETTKMFAQAGIPTYDADAAVHKLYEKGGDAVELIGKAFPGAVVDGAVDRARLSAQVVGSQEEIKRLEAIVHPLVGAAQMNFLMQAEAQGAEMVVLDIPLLFETGGETRVDVTIVVSAPYEVQRLRVLERPDMSEEKFAAILAKQVPDQDKRGRADFVIDTSKGLAPARAQVSEIVATLKTRKGEIWETRKKTSG